MNIKQWIGRPAGKIAAFVLACLVAALGLYWIVADDWSRTNVETDAVIMSQLLPENAVVEQTFTAGMDCLESLVVTPHFNTAEHSGSITCALYAGETLLHEQTVDAAQLVTDAANTIALTQPVENVRDMQLTLKIDPAQTGMSLWAGNTMSAGKFDVKVDAQGLLVNGEGLDVKLVLESRGYNLLRGKQLFWPVALAVIAAAAVLFALGERDLRTGRRTPVTTLVNLCRQYQFLLKQLVSRDFRVKYKASALGVLWSFLNPLLTMLVYLFVFSNIFHSDIPHFPVYLMSGIVLFNFFSDSTALGLLSISSNGPLITKVYMPKVIYPLSKVLSSSINLCISFIPLLIVMLLTGVPMSKSMLLLPLVVLFLLMLSLGMSLLLSTMNVFFRDTQFLWSVAITMLNFLTPVFYPESIVPAAFQTLYHMNPLYQILFFMRSIVIGGVSPTPVTYLYCLLSCAAPLLLGLWIFRRKQDKFVLYL